MIPWSMMHQDTVGDEEGVGGGVSMEQMLKCTNNL